ncbi:MAG TPA: hypothetical protein VHB98_17910 [Chloroflexota bacterium]|nr:hypothetical protein [Chloroflexota bacterium]
MRIILLVERIVAIARALSEEERDERWKRWSDFVSAATWSHAGLVLAALTTQTGSISRRNGRTISLLRLRVLSWPCRRRGNSQDVPAWSAHMTAELPTSFADRLKAQHLAAGLTQEALAERAGVGAPSH